MAERQKNQWNWSATTYVFTPGLKELLCEFDTEQVWDGTKAGHERLWRLLVERLEGERDRLGLSYRVWMPTAVMGQPWADRLPEYVEVE